MQRLYAEARMNGLSPLESAKAAGFKHPEIKWHSYEKHPRIAPLILMMNERVIEKYDLSRDDVIAGFMDAVNAAANSSELTAAWREIGKMLGHYSPEKLDIRHQHSVENMTLNKLESLPEAELLKLAEMPEFTLDRDHDLVANYEVLSTRRVDEDEQDA